MVKRKQDGGMTAKKPVEKKAAPKPRGRPSLYTLDLAHRICERLMQGETLLSICRDDAMPGLSTVTGWLSKDKDFSAMYAHAREVQAEVLADEMREIADDGRNDWMERNGQDAPGWQLNGEHVQRSRLRIDQRKWHASKLAPKRYGDLQKVEHSGSVDVASTLIAARKRSGTG